MDGRRRPFWDGMDIALRRVGDEEECRRRFRDAIHVLLRRSPADRTTTADREPGPGRRRGPRSPHSAGPARPAAGDAGDPGALPPEGATPLPGGAR